MRINWFSPLAPAASGIAEHATLVLPELAAAAAVDAWTSDPRSRPLPRVPDLRLRPIPGDGLPWPELNAGLAVYHIGNSAREHAATLATLMSHPGVVVLHDLRLHHLVAGAYRLAGDREGYLAALEASYDPAARAAGEELWSGTASAEALAIQYPFTAHVLARALAVVVHGRHARAALELGVTAPVITAELPYRPRPWSEELAAAAAARARLDPAGARLVVFGHLGANRGLAAVVDALAAFPHRARLQLDVLGEVDGAARLERQVAGLGLSGQVVLHGPLSEADLDRRLRAAHLALNLRLPTMGECSLSLLRAWDLGLPAVVVTDGWYRTLPSDAVAFVGLDTIQADLHRHFESLLAEPARWAAIGRRGRAVLEAHHGVSPYVSALLAAVDEGRHRRVDLALAEVRERAAVLARGLGPPAVLPLGREGGRAGLVLARARSDGQRARAQTLAAVAAAARRRRERLRDELMPWP